MLQTSGRQPASTSAPTQEFRDAFADSLERDLDAPNPLHGAGPALVNSQRKRARSDGAVNHSPPQPAEAQTSEQPDAHLPSGRGLKRHRTKIGVGIVDPVTPTGADLAASSIAFRGYDAASLSCDEDDFPELSNDELNWLITLLDD